MIPFPRTPARGLALAPVAMCAALVAASPSARALTLYDDFSSTSISPYRWQGTNYDDGEIVIMDTRRILNAGAVRLEARMYGDNNSDLLTSHGEFGMRLSRSPGVTDLKVTITPRTLSAVNCVNNVGYGPSVAGAQAGGGFFTTNALLRPGATVMGDARAYVQVSHATTDAAGVNNVTGVVMRCMDDICRRYEYIGPASLGTVALNTAVTVEVQWDKANHRFLFTRDAQAPVAVNYTWQDTAPAHNTSKGLEIFGTTQTCSTGRIAVFGGADFDNVYTNPLP